MTIHEIWTNTLSKLEVEISAIVYEVYVKTLEPLDIEGEAFVLMAPTAEARDFILNRHRTMIRSLIKELAPAITELKVIEPSERTSLPTHTVPKPKVEPEPEVKPVILNQKYRFDSFVVGKSNRLVAAAAQAVAENPGTSHNPLFIYGGVGLGKTHIMHAVGNAVRENHPELKVLYASSEKFVNEMIESFRIGDKANKAFRDKYRLVDVLLIDDIQFFAGKDRTQEEFFHTFNDLYELGKQIVISSDRPPKELYDIEERLKSRFAWGMTADVQPPDEETRVAILQKKALDLKQNIAMPILELMAKNPFSNIRDMEGLLNKVIFLAKLQGAGVSEETVTEAMRDYKEEQGEEDLTIEDVLVATSKYFGVSVSDIVGKKKTRESVEPRQYCIYLISELLAVPLANIGKRFGGRDHTTIMHSRNKVVGELKTNPRAATIITDIKNILYRK